MDKCRYAVTYKAKRIPGCDCELCWRKWHIREIADKLAIDINLGGLSGDEVTGIVAKLKQTLKATVDGYQKLNN